MSAADKAEYYREACSDWHGGCVHNLEQSSAADTQPDRICVLWKQLRMRKISDSATVVKTGTESAGICNSWASLATPARSQWSPTASAGHHGIGQQSHSCKGYSQALRLSVTDNAIMNSTSSAG
jgi:hypothetical protein